MGKRRLVVIARLVEKRNTGGWRIALRSNSLNLEAVFASMIALACARLLLTSHLVSFLGTFVKVVISLNVQRWLY